MALSDAEGILASPSTIIDRKDDTADIEAITNIVNRYEVKQVIVGLPRSMDGSLGRQAEKVQDFTQKLRNCVGVPVEFRDERLTTVSARRLMREARPRKTRKKVRDDAIAAAVILQSYLDETRQAKSEQNTFGQTSLY